MNRTRLLVCVAFLLCCGTLRYVVVRYAAWRRQRGTTWRQRRHNVTAGLQGGDSVASTWRQRGTLPNFAKRFPERGDQKRGTTAQPKRDTMTGAL